MFFFPGLVNALKLIQHIKEKYSGITYADLFQLASATAIEVHSKNLLFTAHDNNLLILSVIQEAGGPKIPMKYGRVDVSAPNECPEEGRLPGKRLIFMALASSLRL